MSHTSAGATTVHAKKLLEDPDARLSAKQLERLEPLGAAATALAGGMYWLNRFLVRVYFGLEVRGRNNIPDPPCVLSPNHVSYLDGPAVGAALDNRRLQRTHWGGFSGVLEANLFLRTISRLGRILPVDAQRRAVSSLACGAAVLARGEYLVWFPEGGISPDGALQPFKGGVGLLVDHFQAPVTPISIQGTREAYPEKFSWPRRRTMRVTFGKAQYAEELAAMGEGQERHERITSGLRAVMREMLQNE